MNEQLDTESNENDEEIDEPDQEREQTQEEQEENELTPEERIEELKKERDEYKEKFLRKSADLKNLRERKKQERKEYMKYANKSLLKDLLEVIDNFERAIEFESENQEGEENDDGIRMIHDQLVELLVDYDVEKINAEDEDFDPHKHEAMMREERDDLDQQTVLEVFNEGYMLHDRVLRPAKVKVGVPANNESNEELSDD